MTPSDIIEAAINRLIDEYDEDPRSSIISALRRLAATPETLPDVSIRLTATLQPGGKCEVKDQHGRSVESVQTVAVFKDQQGRDVMQINLGN